MLNRGTRSLFLALFLVLVNNFIFSQSRDRSPVWRKPAAESMRAGAFIDVNAPGYPASNYEITQLVKDVLISTESTCAVANVSNVTVSPNLQASSQSRSWGYFNKASTNFPFEQGIVLMTGLARKAGNDFQAVLSDGLSTYGDVDLATALNIDNARLRDATYIEFDFIPNSTEVSFRYIFASKEYTTGRDFTCNISDGFALLLKREGESNYTNLAVLPNGAGPVSVTNIIPSELACGPRNAQYFAGMNTPQIETNFDGRTVPLTAKATVIPGQTYHFKMVLADYQDSNFDSAVFLEAESFDIGVRILGADGAPLPESINVCDNEPQVLTSSIQGSTATYQWLFNNVPIPGATGVSYTATEPGTYTLQVFIAGSTCARAASVTIVGGTAPTVQNATVLACNAPGNVIFNLTAAESSISTTPGVTYTYYANRADANAGNTNTIPNPTAYSSSGGQTVYVLVRNGSCSRVAELQLAKAPQITATIAPPATLTCTNLRVTLDASASTVPEGATIQWTTAGGNIVSGADTLHPVVSAGGTYTLTIQNIIQPGNIICTDTESVTVSEDNSLPVATLVSSYAQICEGESVVLTAGGGTTYNWTDLPGNGNTQTVSPTVTTTYTVYAVGANGCVSTNPASVTIVVGPPIAEISASKSRICAGESVTLTASGGVTYNWEGLTGNGNTQVVSPTETTTYSVYALGAQGCRSIDPATITIEVVPAIVSTLEDVYVCAGNTGVLDAGSGPGYTYLWSTGATTQTISTNVAGAYTVTISNGTCSQNFTAQLRNPDLPQFTNIVYENHTLTLTTSNPTNEILEYSIDGGLSWQDSNVFYNILDNTNYNLVVRVKGAECSSSLTYYTFMISNAITPNSDGHNDVIDFSGISHYNNFSASIFDRYGQEIFKATKAEPVWNGTVRGSALPTATYWYKVQWENPASKKLEVRTGWILLKNRN